MKVKLRYEKNVAPHLSFFCLITIMTGNVSGLPQLDNLESKTRVLAKALKMLFWLCNLFPQIFHFFHIFNFWWNNHWNISSDFQSSIFFDQIESDLSKMDQTWSNLITFDFWWDNHWNISSDFQLYIFFDQIESDLTK